MLEAYLKGRINQLKSDYALIKFTENNVREELKGHYNSEALSIWQCQWELEKALEVYQKHLILSEEGSIIYNLDEQGKD